MLNGSTSGAWNYSPWVYAAYEETPAHGMAFDSFLAYLKKNKSRLIKSPA
jgi:hypothetical protein